MEVKIVVMKCKYSGSWQYPPLRAKSLRTFRIDAKIFEVWIAYFDSINELRASRLNIGSIASNDAKFWCEYQSRYCILMVSTDTKVRSIKVQVFSSLGVVFTPYPSTTTITPITTPYIHYHYAFLPWNWGLYYVKPNGKLNIFGFNSTLTQIPRAPPLTGGTPGSY